MRARLPIIIAGVAAAGFAGVFSMLELPADDPSRAMVRLTLCYWLPFAAAWAALSWLAWTLPQREQAGSFCRSAAVVVAVALALRVALVLTSSPQLSDDLWRYVHDGSVLAQGDNPYALSPAERASPVSQRVNHRELVTIYQPLSQWVFAGLYRARSLRQTHDALGDATFRLGFVLADLLVVLLLLVKLRGDDRSPWWAALYAWHPLAISEVAGSGHQEPIGIAMVLAALLCMDRRTTRAALLAGIAMAGAVAVKPIVLPLALPLIWMHRREPARMMAAVGSAAAAGLLLYGPFLFMPGGMDRHFETVSTFMHHWRFNGSLHPLIERITEQKIASDWCMATLLVGVILVGMRMRLDAWRMTGIYLFASLLLSSTVYPWYLLWALALTPVRFSAAVWVWSLSITLSYAVLRDPAAWQLPVWAQTVQYAAVAAALAWDFWRLFKTKKVEPQMNTD